MENLEPIMDYDGISNIQFDFGALVWKQIYACLFFNNKGLHDRYIDAVQAYSDLLSAWRTKQYEERYNKSMSNIDKQWKQIPLPLRKNHAKKFKLKRARAHFRVLMELVEQMGLGPTRLGDGMELVEVK